MRNAESGKGRPLQAMFAGVPRRYDLLNRMLTARFDEAWRKRAAEEILRGGPRRVLDVGCGTGDLTLRLARGAQGGTLTVGLDFSAPMLEEARKKAAAVRGTSLSFVCGDASRMPFPDGSFDAVGFAFSFRNLSWRNPLRDPCLSETLRILRPGGKCVIVETSQPSSRLLKALYHAYLRMVVPQAGIIVSGQGAAYRYLAASARDFPGMAELASILLGAGFRTVRHTPFLGGVAALHVAVR